MKKYLTAITLVLYLLVSGFVGYICFLMFAPMSSWVKYEFVMPVKNSFTIHDQLRFTSKRIVSRKCSLDFNDILYCKFDDSDEPLQAVNFYRSSRNNIPPDTKPQIVTWPYKYIIDSPGECYLESNITLRLPFGISKTQVIIGPTFRIEDKTND